MFNLVKFDILNISFFFFFNNVIMYFLRLKSRELSRTAQL